MSFTTQAGHTAAHLYAFKCSGSGWPEVCCGSRDRLLPPFVFRSLPVLGLAKKNMGDRQRFDHGILKEGFLGKAKLNKVSQLFSKKGKTGVFLSWNHGYWVLRSSLLFEGYKTANKSSKDLTKTFNLNHCENVNVCNFTSSKKIVYAFKLRIYSHGATKEYLFNSENERDRDAWVEMIVDLCGLSPDDDNYEWLDFNYTPNDRRLMTARKQESIPPLPPIPRGMGTLEPPERPRPKQPMGQYEFALGSVEELNKTGTVGSYGFLSTMSHGGDLPRPPSLPPPLPPPNSKSAMSLSSQEEYNSDDDSDVDEYEETFEPISYPGGGGKTELVFQPPSDVVQASFSRPDRPLMKPAMKPPIERSSPVPTPKWMHPADRPPMPLPSEVTESHSSPLPHALPHPPKHLPPPPPPMKKLVAAQDPPVPIPPKKSDYHGHADVPQHGKQRPPPPPPTATKPGPTKVSPPPLPVGSRPLPLIPPMAGGGVPIPVPPRTSRETSNAPQMESPRQAMAAGPHSGRADVRPPTPTSSDRPDHGQPPTSPPKMPSELEKLLHKRRDLCESTEHPQPLPGKHGKIKNEGKRPLTPPSMKSPTDSSPSRTAQSTPKSSRPLRSPPPPDVATKHWRHQEDCTDDSGVSSDSGPLEQPHSQGREYYNTSDVDARVAALSHPGHYSFEHGAEDVISSPFSPVPHFPTPSPSLSESSTASATNKTAIGRTESLQSNQGSLDGRSVFGSQPTTPRTDNEPIYMNWPIHEDTQRERERESASPTPPPPPVRRYSVGPSDGQKKSKTVTRGQSAASADRVHPKPHATAARGKVNRSYSEECSQSGPFGPSPVLTRRPPPVGQKPRPEPSKSGPARSKAAPMASPLVNPSATTSGREKFEQTRAGIAGKIAMFQNQ